MSSIGSPSPFFLAGKKAYQVERSLRFNDGDSAVLTRTPSGAGNRKKYTISAWVKRCSIGGVHPIFARYTANNDAGFLGLYINSDDYIYFSGWSTVNLRSSRLYRDSTAWAHIVLAVDTTQSTSTDRIKLYFNGELQTLGSYNAFSQNADTGINEAVEHRIGNYNPSGGNFFDGYMADIHFLDGYAYDSSYFGKTDATTGQWNPKKYTGSYGTNGFYLNFSDNSGTTATTLGKDSSGNGNNFTPNNFGTGDAVKDNPTNNFAILNPLDWKYDKPTFSEGNLKWTTNTTLGSETVFSSFYFPNTGKWYLEVVAENINIVPYGYAQILSITSDAGGARYLWAVYGQSQAQINTDSGIVNVGTVSNGDIFQLAFDADTGKIWFGKNDTWFLSGDPANGTAMSSAATNTGSNARFFIDGRSGNATNRIIANFGQDSSFANSKTAQGNTDGNGKGDFYYAPPTGFKALCSANLPDPTILLPNKHFDTLPYEGNNSTQSVTGLQFKPDWLWIKNRDRSSVHGLYDSVRGASQALFLGTNRTEAESTPSPSNDALISFDANGFSLGANSNTPAPDVNYVNGDDYVAWSWNAGATDGKTYTVKVHDFSGNSRYIFDDFQTQAVELDLAEGGTYIFNMDDSSNASHPFSIGTAANGTVYTSGITYFLDGVSKTYSEYTSGFSAASTRRLHITVPASAPVLYYWCSVHSGMGGEINTNSTLGSSNFDGSIQSTVKVNATAGFSIVTYTGNGSSGATIGHGIGVAPDALILKRRDGSNSWQVFHQALGNQKFLDLHDSAAAQTSSNRWNNTSPTSTVFTVGNNSNVNSNDGTEVAYCFSEVASYSKFGSYVGNGNSDGVFVFTGFRPAWLMVKRTNGSRNWTIVDNKRDEDNPTQKELYPDLDRGDYTDTGFDFLSNGFKLRTTETWKNGNGDTYIFLAFAESPFKNARAR